MGSAVPAPCKPRWAKKTTPAPQDDVNIADPPASFVPPKLQHRSPSFRVFNTRPLSSDSFMEDSDIEVNIVKNVSGKPLSWPKEETSPWVGLKHTSISGTAYFVNQGIREFKSGHTRLSLRLGGWETFQLITEDTRKKKPSPSTSSPSELQGSEAASTSFSLKAFSNDKYLMWKGEGAGFCIDELPTEGGWFSWGSKPKNQHLFSFTFIEGEEEKEEQEGKEQDSGSGRGEEEDETEDKVAASTMPASSQLREAVATGRKVRIKTFDGYYMRIYFPLKKPGEAKIQGAYLTACKEEEDADSFQLVLAEDPTITVPEPKDVERVLIPEGEDGGDAKECDSGRILAEMCYALYPPKQMKKRTTSTAALKADASSSSTARSSSSIPGELYRAGEVARLKSTLGKDYTEEVFFGSDAIDLQSGKRNDGSSSNGHLAHSSNTNGAMLLLYSTAKSRRGRDLQPMYVIFRGTTSFKDLRADIESVALAPFDGSKGSVCGQGFVRQLKLLDCSVRRQKPNFGLIKYLMLRAARASNVVIAGHSLGGALASLCFYALQKHEHAAPSSSSSSSSISPSTLRHKLLLRTFGAPKVFRVDLAAQLQAAYVPSDKDARCIRYVFANDPIPSLPPLPAYSHFGLERKFMPRDTKGSGSSSNDSNLVLISTSSSPTPSSSSFSSSIRDWKKSWRLLHYHQYLADLAEPIDGLLRNLADHSQYKTAFIRLQSS
mmetsp:Transcript_18162/g.25201  ORF Transcript_18162/g.25201 Transcript_18162/m.25201 type:complete len:718 (+) Transcript_18162:1-2154(+)